jgi:hypothetical protein
MTKITEKIKEAAGAAGNLSKFKKFSKLKASYVEYDKFEDSNLHEKSYSIQPLLRVNTFPVCGS